MTVTASDVNETTPLIHGSQSNATKSLRTAYWDELKTLTGFALPVIGLVFLSLCELAVQLLINSAGLMEFSLPVMSVLSIGHISTTALAGSTLGTMTASVTGLSLLVGFASALDTVLPSAWTSKDPTLVGIWAQRMGSSLNSRIVLKLNATCRVSLVRLCYCAVYFFTVVVLFLITG